MQVSGFRIYFLEQGYFFSKILSEFRKKIVALQRMPQVFKIGSYWVYFWANENEPLEPVHVHVAQGAPSANATKIWITRAGKCYLSNNNSQIPPRVLRNIMAVIEARSAEVVAKWTSFFGEAHYFC